MKSRQTIVNLVMTALFAAMIMVLTFSVKVPTGTGYIHLGDAMIYLAASFLPTPLAALAAALGGAFADYAASYFIYIIPTFIIKALIAIPFSAKQEKVLCRRNMIAVVVSGLITAIGYYITRIVILAMADNAGTMQAIVSPTIWGAALYNIPENLIQAAGSAILYLMIAAAFDKAGVKRKLKSNLRSR